MKLKSILLLAGFTARTQAYIQAMARADLLPEHTIFFGPEKPIFPGQVSSVGAQSEIPGLFIPDLSIPAKKTCADHNCSFSVLPCESVNDKEILLAIKKHSPAMIIYSGYGKQLVSEELVDMGIPLLHMHAGWLPDYRGSTTIYYSILQEGNCGVSAILLRRAIDEGPVILRKKYPPPPVGVDPDYVYDTAIRADLLVNVMVHLGEHNELPDSEEQEEEGGCTYYVIHPVLKHLAFLSLLR
ncbi:MAG: formyltransferase family protein [Candidatus Scalindua sp.]